MSTANYNVHKTVARDAFHSAVLQDLFPIDPSFKGLPWLGIDGKALKIPRVGREEAPQFLAIASAIDSGQDFSSGIPIDFRADLDWNAVEFKLKTIATDRPLDDRIVRELSEPHLQEQFVIQIGTEAVIQRFNYLFIHGNEAASLNEQEFDGIDVLCTVAQSQASSANMVLDLGYLLSMIQSDDGIPTAFIMHRQAERQLLMEAQWGNTVGPLSTTGSVPLRAMMHPVFGMRLHFCGIPILPNDHITVGGSPPYNTTIYAVQFGIGTGLAGIFPGRNGEMGVRIEKRHDDDTDTWFLKIKLECGLALYRETAVAKITTVATPDAVSVL